MGGDLSISELRTQLELNGYTELTVTPVIRLVSCLIATPVELVFSSTVSNMVSIFSMIWAVLLKTYHLSGLTLADAVVVELGKALRVVLKEVAVVDTLLKALSDLGLFGLL
jgi:hypothetical protein